MRSLVGFAISAALLVGCGSRTIGDGFDIDTTPESDAALTDSSSTSSDSTPPSTDCATPFDDGGTVEPSPTIRCGGDVCIATSQDCCVTGGGGGGSAMCVPKGSCARGIALSCSSPASCGGQACCFVASDRGGSATCNPSCMGRGTYRLCETDADCTMGRRCRNAMFGGLRACL